MTDARLLSIQVGLPRTMGHALAGDPLGKLWTSGIVKESPPGPVRVTRTNLPGDRQADTQHHGGPDKAVNAMPSEHYPYWSRTLDRPLPTHGAFGENFTTEGLLEGGVCIGDVFEVGEAVVQISQPRQPCWKLARHWRLKDFAALVQRSGRTGWYFRVLREGTVEAGLPLRLSERPHPEWTVSRANEVMNYRKDDLDAARALAACPALSESWRAGLLARVARA